MLAYIPAPWILWDIDSSWEWGKKNRPFQISSGKSRAVRFHLFHPKEYPELRTIRERLGPNVSNTRPRTRRWSSEKTQRRRKTEHFVLQPKELRRLHKRNPPIMSDLLRNWYHLVLVAVLKNAGLREKLGAGCNLSRFHFQPHDHSMAIPGTDLLEVPTIYKAYFSGLNFRESSPQNMALKIWYSSVPPLIRILEISHWIIQISHSHKVYPTIPQLNRLTEGRYQRTPHSGQGRLKKVGMVKRWYCPYHFQVSKVFSASFWRVTINMNNL